MTSTARVLDAMERPVLLVRPYERKKPNVVELAADARRDVEGVRLDEARPLEDKAVRYFCGLNLAALVMYYTGEYARAAEICRREIDMATGLAAAGCSAHWAFYAVEATLNTARLDALRGDRHSAVALCRQLLQFAFQRGRLTLGGCTITRADLETAPADDEENRKGMLRRLNGIGGMAVWEANKAFLLASDYDGLLRFLDEPVINALTTSRVFASALMEARFKALMGLGQFDEACEVLRALRQLLDEAQDAAALRRTAILYAQLHLARGEREPALEWAARSLDRLDRDGRPGIEVWYVRYRSALIHLIAGEHGQAKAIELGRLARAQCATLGDQVAVIKTLCLLLQADEVDVEGICRQLEQEAVRCYYTAEAALAYAELGSAYSRIEQAEDEKANARIAMTSAGALARAAAHAKRLTKSPLEAHVTGRCRELLDDSRPSFADSPRHSEQVEELFEIALRTDPFAPPQAPPAVIAWSNTGRP
jgi:tetratricopeptide (TPR) repeat protein